MEVMAFMEAMGTSNVPLVAAFFIGLMTAFSPCPLATNITAVAYISRKIDNSKHTLFVGIVYTLGRMFSYAGLASLIVYVGVNSREIALFLQDYGEMILGPLLLIIGLVMLEVIKLNLGSGYEKLDKIKERLSDEGYLGAFLLGIIFALSFCPFSGVLYFGMLIPLAVKVNDGILVPSVFALATGIPVILSSILLIKSASRLGEMINKAQEVEKTVRKLVAATFLIVGLYYIALAIS